MNYLDNVQGGFLTGAGTTLMYAASTVGITSAVTGNGGEIGAFILASVLQQYLMDSYSCKS